MKNFNTIKRHLPASMKNRQKWNLSRKHFIRAIVAGGVLTQFPISAFSSTIFSNQEKYLTDSQSEIIKAVQNILFPSDGNGPGAKEINAFDYLQWVLSDKEMDPDEVKYVYNGIDWVNETSEEVFSKQFVSLSNTERENLIEKISHESWGESWLSVVLTFIFEALLCDPQYGGNPNQMGWNWLNHKPGQPRPTKELLYPEILTIKLPRP